jgi:HlyD family secretion protein
MAMGSARAAAARRVLVVAVAAALGFAAFVIRAEDPKPEEAKPAEAKPAESKPTDSKAADSKPADAKAPETQKTTSPSTKQSPPATAPADASAAVPAHVVKKGTLSLTVQGEGTFKPVDAFEVRPRLLAHQGPLTILSAAQHGAVVKKGDAILEFDQTLIKNDLTSAESDLASAKAGLEKSQSDLALGTAADARAMRMSETDLSNAEAAQKWWENVDGPQMLRQNALQVKLSKANVEDQADELDQLRKMYKDEDLTSATADIVVKRAVRQLDVAKASLKMTEERSEKLKSHHYPMARQETLDVLEGARQKLAMLKASQAQTAVLRKGALVAAQLAVANVERKLGDLNKDAANFAFKAPADGVVFYGQYGDGTWVGGDPKALRVGERASAGGILMTLYTPGKLNVKMPLPESQSAWVMAGTKARVVPVAYPELAYDASCGGPVVVTKAGLGLGFELTLDVPQLDPRVQPGMKANVTVEATEVADVLLVPNSALSGGKVWRRGKDGKESQVLVSTGRSDGKMTEIRSGLSEGDEVLAQGKK